MGFLELAREAYRRNQWAGSVETDQSKSTFLQPIHQEMEVEDNIPLIDQKARAAGFLVGISGELYFATLFERAGMSTMIFVEHSHHHWMAWRETFKKGQRHAVGIRNIASGYDLDFVLKQAKTYAERFRGT